MQAIVSCLRQLPGIRASDNIFTSMLLSSLRSRAAFFGCLHGKWINHTGLPQGGALSTGLFGLVTLALYNKLIDLETGVSIGEGIFPAQAYMWTT